MIIFAAAFAAVFFMLAVLIYCDKYDIIYKIKAL